MNRYDIDWTIAEMIEYEHGDYVLYEEAAARIAELEAQIAAMKLYPYGNSFSGAGLAAFAKLIEQDGSLNR